MEPDIGHSQPTVRRPGLHWLPHLIWFVLWGGYAGLVAVATATHHARPAAWLLVALLALATAQALFDGRRGSALFSALNLCVVAIVFAFRGPFTAIGLTTAIIQAFISSIFFRGLGAGRTDIVTRMACAVRPERSTRELAYTRRVAWGWAVLLAGMSAGSLAIGFAAGGALWWWWMNGASYAVPIGFFVGEWLFRQWWLREEFRVAGPIDWRRVRHIDYARLLQP